MAALTGPRPVSAETLGRVLNQMAPEQLQGDLAHYLHCQRRNKVLDDNPWPLRFVVMDGHEFFSLLPPLLPRVPDANGPHP